MDPILLTALPFLLWALVAGASILTVLLGGILAYHWFRYAMNPATALIAVFVYGGISFLLLSGLVGATIAITSL